MVLSVKQNYTVTFDTYDNVAETTQPYYIHHLISDVEHFLLS